MYTISEAVKETGKSKATIHRAIKTGKISAQKNEAGHFMIDPSELLRVYPRRTGTSQKQRNETKRDAGETVRDGTKIKVLEVRLEAAQQLADEREKTIEDLRVRLDRSTTEQTKLTALLTDQRPAPKGFWARLTGK